MLGLVVETVPAAYRECLEHAVSRAVEEIKLDAHRRENGAAPLIADEWIHPEKTGEICVAIGLNTDAVVKVVRAAGEVARSERRTA